MVLLTAPLGIIGVAAGAAGSSERRSASSRMLGTIALGGMIMRNTVILVDQIRQDVEAGCRRWEAIRESTVRRFRPDRADRGGRDAGHDPAVAQRAVGADGLAIMGGLIVATLLTLLFVPALYAAWHRVRRPAV